MSERMPSRCNGMQKKVTAWRMFESISRKKKKREMKDEQERERKKIIES